MSKKTNTILFVLGATVFNIVITISSFVGLLVFYLRLIVPHIPADARVREQAWPYVLIFMAAIAISFMVYRFAIRFLTNKVDVEQYFDPVFGPRRK